MSLSVVMPTLPHLSDTPRHSREVDPLVEIGKLYRLEYENVPDDYEFSFTRTTALSLRQTAFGYEFVDGMDFFGLKDKVFLAVDRMSSSGPLRGSNTVFLVGEKLICLSFTGLKILVPYSPR